MPVYHKQLIAMPGSLFWLTLFHKEFYDNSLLKIHVFDLTHCFNNAKLAQPLSSYYANIPTMHKMIRIHLKFLLRVVDWCTFTCLYVLLLQGYHNLRHKMWLRICLTKYVCNVKRPVHAQFNCTVCLNTKLSKDCTIIWTEGETLLAPQFRQILVTLDEGHLFYCSFRYHRVRVTYDRVSHLIRTDLTKRFTEEIVQFIGEK